MIRYPTCIAATAASLLLATSLPLHGAGLPDMIVPHSLGVQTKPDTTTPESLKTIRDTGVCYVRRGFHWIKIESVKGQYDFADCDRFFDATQRLGLGVIGCLFGGNRQYEEGRDGGIQTEQGRKGFAAFAAAMAQRYKGRQILWEVWNEPNVHSFWRKSGKHNSDDFAGEYTELVKAVATAMLRSDPDCFVVAGSVSNYWEPSYQWTEFCFKRGILKTGIRGWSVHPYGVKTPEEHVIGHTRTRQLLTQYGASADFPILNTERGFAVQKTGEGWSGGSEQKALEYESCHLVREYMIDLMSGVRLTDWYEWYGEKFGIVNAGKERPVAKALRVMVEQLDGCRFDKRIDLPSSLDYVLQFVNDKTGAVKLVAWTSPPPRGTPDQAQPHTVKIPVLASGSLPTVQIYGEQSAVKVGNEAVTLALSGAPQYVTVRSAK